MPAPKPPYPAEFRQQMVELVHAGAHRRSSRVSSTLPHRASRVHWLLLQSFKAEVVTGTIHSNMADGALDGDILPNENVALPSARSG